MSEDRDLERRLDDAFASTRPRRGFEDELWGRLRRREPWWRWRPSWNPIPALGAVAVLLVVGIAALTMHPGGLGAPGKSSSSTSGSAYLPNSDRATGASGVAAPRLGLAELPRPGALSAPPEGRLPSGPDGVAYYGSAELTWTGSLPGLPPLLPVYRYASPSAAESGAFVSGLNAGPAPAPAPSGAYAGPDFNLRLLPPQPAREPLFALTPLGPAGPAEVFLAQHGLRPDWPSQRVLDAAAGRLQLRRLFDIPGVGQVPQVDQRGEPAGLEVQISPAGAVLAVVGPLPLSVDVQWTPARAADQVTSAATAASQPGSPKVTLNRARIVYIAVPAGQIGYFQPAYLFTGTFELDGQRFEKRVLVAAV